MDATQQICWVQYCRGAIPQNVAPRDA